MHTLQIPPFTPSPPLRKSAWSHRARRLPPAAPAPAPEVAVPLGMADPLSICGGAVPAQCIRSKSQLPSPLSKSAWSYRARRLPPAAPAPPTAFAVQLGTTDPLGIGGAGGAGGGAGIAGAPTPIAVAMAVESPKDGFPTLSDAASAPHFLHGAAPLASDGVCRVVHIASRVRCIAPRRTAAHRKPHKRCVAECTSGIASDRKQQPMPRQSAAMRRSAIRKAPTAADTHWRLWTASQEGRVTGGDERCAAARRLARRQRWEGTEP